MRKRKAIFILDIYRYPIYYIDNQYIDGQYINSRYVGGGEGGMGEQVKLSDRLPECLHNVKAHSYLYGRLEDRKTARP